MVCFGFYGDDDKKKALARYEQDEAKKRREEEESAENGVDSANDFMKNFVKQTGGM